MKTAIAIATAGLVSLGLAATPAAAFKLSPAGNFTADGNTSASKNGITLPCHAHFTGTISNKGVGHITSGTFTTSSGPQGACEAIVLNNLPWKTVARTATTGKIYNVQFAGPAGLNCGPGNLVVHVKSGIVSFTTQPLPPGCTVTGKLTTNPTVSIVE
ncbi:MAG TPA: hypothetical protein VGG69_04165 [Rhizomicrobium sp.]